MTFFSNKTKPSAVRTGKTYISMSTDRVPEGELRGQIHAPTCYEAQLQPAVCIPSVCATYACFLREDMCRATRISRVGLQKYSARMYVYVCTHKYIHTHTVRRCFLTCGAFDVEHGARATLLLRVSYLQDNSVIPANHA